MAFSEAVKQQAYKRSGGRCECTRQHLGALNAPHHGGRCPSLLLYGWHAHHKVSVLAGGSDTLSNCEALCVRCHELTRSYGG